MFAKPYKLKSNNTLKNSEKKQLAQRIIHEFPTITEEKVKQLVPAKSIGICMKLVLSSGDIVNVYVMDGVPIIMEVAEGLVPTVCALWQAPEMVPHIIIHTPVFPKVQGGAPLYLPGVELPAGGTGFPQFCKGELIAAHTSNNSATVIVGRAILSSGDMLLRTAGVCMETLHVFGDHLSKDIKFGKLERPKLGPPAYGGGNAAQNLANNIQKLSIQPAVKEEWPALGQPPAPVPNEPQLIPEPPNPVVDALTQLEDGNCLAIDSDEEDNVPTDMDGLLRWCMLSFLKLEGNKVELPLKTNLLYRNHLMALCPAERTLDVKKSSFKKMGKFLEAMEKEGLVRVCELEKGVDAVVQLSPSHPAVRAHPPPRAPARPAPRAGPAPPAPPRLREVQCVTAAVAPLFAPLKKGTALTPADVRATLTGHVRSAGLAVPGQSAVRLDLTLATVLGRQPGEHLTWEELMSGVLKKMTPSTEIQFADGELRLSRSRLEPVTMQVVNRSGNKKVTLVSNLEAYGFNLLELSAVCQRGVAASCGVTRSPGAKHDQLMLQGDQTHFVAKLLIEKYGLPKKFVEGADKALNRKK
ncbi:eukaryotic translation initiation factor 2D isoform X1 [Bombyx mandarina]|uniref:Eukaryotic translation initiation factor 2D isoform X1 n=1 Tax=Bombyx mandarina TaxID=7092 RepID=A0A6J2K4Q8_BOMMA|nr:eukaryotic translation initiation factor 2D isoform X1 [Bombyx mandarina]